MRYKRLIIQLEHLAIHFARSILRVVKSWKEDRLVGQVIAIVGIFSLVSPDQLFLTFVAARWGINTSVLDILVLAFALILVFKPVITFNWVILSVSPFLVYAALVIHYASIRGSKIELEAAAGIIGILLLVVRRLLQLLIVDIVERVK